MALEGGSIPPPGWTAGTTALADTIASVSTVRGVQAPTQAAVRWRISAAIIDNVLVYGLYLLICLALHWRVADPAHLLALLPLGVLYHFALESRDGQTIGKRQYGLRVTSIDGQPADRKAIAIRSVIRIIDQLPVCYVSGLVSMIRTGSERRQRLGDVVAATKVVAVEGRSRAQGTPGWMLPVATLVAIAFSALTVFGIVNAGNAPLDSAQAARFVAGCDASSHGVIDCQCILTRLEADGYNSINGLKSVMEQAQAERLSGEQGPALAELQTDGRACLR